MRAADLLVRCLEEEGVTHVCGVQGEEILPLLDALHDGKIVKVSGASLEQGVRNRTVWLPPKGRYFEIAAIRAHLPSRTASCSPNCR
jgi:hypothetical protein